MIDRPKKRRGPGRAMLENLKNAGPPLREGEITRTHRVRAAADVHGWFASLTAEERGELLARLMVAEAPAGAGEGPRADLGPPGRIESKREHLALGTVPTVGLRPYEAKVVKAMREGATLSRAAGEAWKLSTTGGGSVPVRGDTVSNLLFRGVLREIQPQD